MPRTKKRDFDKMARAFLANGGKIGEAMVAGGYPKSSSKRGKGSMCSSDREQFKKAMDRHVDKTLTKYEDIGKSVTAEQQEHLVRGALLSNVAQGKDKATASLKMLGTD